MSDMIAKVSDAYIATRNEISELNKKIDELKELQEKREGFLLGELTKLGLQNLKTPAGVTVYKTKTESVTMGDWDSALAWVKENDAWEFLTRGFAKKAVLEHMGENRETAPPPGCNYVAKLSVGIRKG